MWEKQKRGLKEYCMACEESFSSSESSSLFGFNSLVFLWLIFATKVKDT